MKRKFANIPSSRKSSAAPFIRMEAWEIGKIQAGRQEGEEVNSLIRNSQRACGEQSRTACGEQSRTDCGDQRRIATRNLFRQPLIESLERRELLSASALAFHRGHISATVGSDSQGPVAIVVGKNVPTSASDYQATIDWGDFSAPDSNVSVSTIRGGKVVMLTASHVYAQPGKFIVKADVSIDGQQPEVVQDRVHVDRKSTRLNSSHPSISYAVF